MEEVMTIQSGGNHITNMLSVADLIQLGGYCAVEYCGGPAIPFKYRYFLPSLEWVAKIVMGMICLRMG